MQPITDHAGQAARINPRHVTHVICYTEASPVDPALHERMGVGLVTGEKLTFQYRTPADASRAARTLGGTPEPGRTSHVPAGSQMGRRGPLRGRRRRGLRPAPATVGRQIA